MALHDSSLSFTFLTFGWREQRLVPQDRGADGSHQRKPDAEAAATSASPRWRRPTAARRRRARAACSGREGEQHAAGGGREVIERWPSVSIENHEFETEAARSVLLWSERRGQSGHNKGHSGAESLDPGVVGAQ